MRAKILSEPKQEVTPNIDELSQVSSYDPDDVYSVKIIKIFKGEENVTALPGIRTVAFAARVLSSTYIRQQNGCQIDFFSKRLSTWP